MSVVRRAVLEPLGGDCPNLASPRPGPDLQAAGWTEQELLARGTAERYAADTLPADGCWSLTAAGEADYATRVVVRRPADPAAFNGTLVVEWLNVSSGQDAAPGWIYLSDELVRRGFAWAGVSAQFAGVEGGIAAVAVESVGAGLRGSDPDRYAAVHHPGDAWSYDIFTQVAAGLLASTDAGALAGLAVETVLAHGESQSAFALTTYVNGVHPLAQLFDGFLVHSRGGAAAPLGEPGTGLRMADVVAGAPTRFRDDLASPVVVVETETDLFGHLGYLPARQPDGHHLRVWEVAGTAHADKFLIGEFEPFLGATVAINRGQQAYVVRAALHALDRWARGGPPPPSADPLETRSEGFVLDAVGNARGGVRTPAVDAPVEVLSGLAPVGASTLVRLFGSTVPLAPERLVELHSSRSGYLAAYERATDAAVAAGFVLPEDREAVLSEARPDLLP